MTTGKLVAASLPYHPVADMFARFAAEPYALLLDSQTGGGVSYIAVRPRDMLEIFAGTPDPLKQAAALLNAAGTTAALPGLPPFQTGWAGVWHYEAGCTREGIPHQYEATEPLIALGYYDVVAAYDHDRKQAWLIWQETAAAKAVVLRGLLESAPMVDEAGAAPSLLFAAQDEGHYVDAVRRTQEYIRAGDIYQANVAQRWCAKTPQDYQYYTAFKALRGAHPAPYAAYWRGHGSVLLSASPELFLESDGQTVSARPIKGTLPSSADANTLKEDPKNRAENLMIVDLLRNDIAQSCVPGSVRVPSLYALETHPTVHHLVSTITGTLSPGTTALDAFVAAFPGGSITGAPKIRAMEIIAELERAPRRAYCGSIGFFSATGALSMNIAIRTVIFDAHTATLWGGSGITHGSDAAAESMECATKISGIRRCLEEK
ncbi:MAG: anthranilate synthase component I family protein [Alphaproteobacteria bacterium]|nr:anthranilate synthase component I family protein [Thalassospira sp.]MCE2964169.1 anthranilate synthase component I family protein [Alphaproteobacteria bacterium]